MREPPPFSFNKTISILQCQSTMNIMRVLSGEAEGLTVVSIQQFSGKGRSGNEWVSRPGGLYFSFLLKPTFLPHLNEKLYLLTTQTVRDVISSYLPKRKIDFKMPNDVMVNGKKISGVLVEAKTEGNKNLFMIVGIGINVSNPVPETACSLEMEGAKGVSPTEVLERFHQHFEKVYNIWMAQSIA